MAVMKAYLNFASAFASGIFPSVRSRKIRSTSASSAGAYMTTTNEYMRVVNTLDHHRFYDSGLRCTWEIAVTNGCFFAEQISTNNLLSGGAR